MKVCVLGPLVVRDGTVEVAAGGPIQRRVLARLAMEYASKPYDDAAAFDFGLHLILEGLGRLLG